MFNLMVQQLDESRQQLEIASRTDALTGVNNRRHFPELLVAEIERCRRYSRSLSVMMFDLDHFEKVNDTYGSAAGDRGTPPSPVRCSGLDYGRNDFWGRLGGEEFALALPETGMDSALIPAERIVPLLEETSVAARPGYVPNNGAVSASVRIKPEDTIETVLGRADQAMYEAKQTGRNRICLALP